MKTPFFITGLPRSRTAWLANLFTTGDTLCFHEPTGNPLDLIRKHSRHRVGISDSMLLLKFRELVEAFPDAPWLYVERDPEDALLSFLRFTKDVAHFNPLAAQRLFAKLLRAAEVLKEAPIVKVVGFDQLAAPAAVEAVWSHLLPEPFPRERWAILDGLKIEQRVQQRLQEHMRQRSS